MINPFTFRARKHRYKVLSSPSSISSIGTDSSKFKSDAAVNSLRHRTTVLLTMFSLPIALCYLIWHMYLFNEVSANVGSWLGYNQAAFLAPKQCPDYSSYSMEHRGPYSSGNHNLSFQRPIEDCRTFSSPDVESTIRRMKNVIKDPDLSRLFENAFPNTLDTAIRWKGFYQGTDQDLAFVITGDIDAMWIRDSANQLISYRSILKPSNESDSLAALFRGVINLQSQYIGLAPFCNAFKPPSSAGIPMAMKVGNAQDSVDPPSDPKFVWECKFELDSLASYLSISNAYFNATEDVAFFARYNWVKTVELILKTVKSMSVGTYGPDGRVLPSPYVFQRQTTRSTETLSNDGLGEPVANGTGLIRSPFRPSDDATIYQLFIPANMMFSINLQHASDIMAQINGQESLAEEMKDYANLIKKGIYEHGTMKHPKFGQIFAYEVDGFSSYNAMDDANIPSLLAAPMMGFMNNDDPIYLNTRKYVLSDQNPYYMRGPALSGVGGPHAGPGMAWPMSLIVKALTTDDDEEIAETIKIILSTTNGLGLIHESIDTFDTSRWTRQWFSWANGLFGELLLDLEKRKPHLLQRTYQ